MSPAYPASRLSLTFPSLALNPSLQFLKNVPLALPGLYTNFFLPFLISGMPLLPSLCLQCICQNLIKYYFPKEAIYCLLIKPDPLVIYGFTDSMIIYNHVTLFLALLVQCLSSSLI